MVTLVSVLWHKNIDCLCCLVAKSCQTLCDPMNCSPSSSFCPWDFSGNNNGVGCHFLLQGNLLPPGTELVSPALASRYFTTEPPGKPKNIDRLFQKMKWHTVFEIGVGYGSMKSTCVPLSANTFTFLVLAGLASIVQENP